MRIITDLDGNAALGDFLTKAGPRGIDVLKRALHEEALLAFAQSQRQVPRRTGVLAGSGQVQSPQVSGETVEVVIGYGGAASDYALIVHEDLEANHAGGTKAKYLEDPVRQQMQGLGGRIVERMERIMAE